MNIGQCAVIHVRYGRGTVVSCTDEMIKVDFGEAGVKQFVYPDAFERFLRAEDPAVAAQAAEDIIRKKAQEDADRRAREALARAIAEAAAPKTKSGKKVRKNGGRS